MTTRTVAFWLIAGAAVALVAQLYVPSRDGARWWLDSHQGVETTVRALFAAGIVSGLTMSWPPWRQARWLLAFFLWVGGTVGFTAMLFATGPGNLWPIAMAIGSLISLPAIGFGAVVGAIARGVVDLALRLRRGSSSSAPPGSAA